MKVVLYAVKCMLERKKKGRQFSVKKKSDTWSCLYA